MMFDKVFWLGDAFVMGVAEASVVDKALVLVEVLVLSKASVVKISVDQQWSEVPHTFILNRGLSCYPFMFYIFWGNSIRIFIVHYYYTMGQWNVISRNFTASFKQVSNKLSALFSQGYSIGIISRTYFKCILAFEESLPNCQWLLKIVTHKIFQRSNIPNPPSWLLANP